MMRSFKYGFDAHISWEEKSLAIEALASFPCRRKYKKKRKRIERNQSKNKRLLHKRMKKYIFFEQCKVDYTNNQL